MNQSCKHCKTPMQYGHALSGDYKRLLAWRVGPLVIGGLGSKGNLNTCLKCPKCGYSVTA